jgi:hypothetical protein
MRRPGRRAGCNWPSAGRTHTACAFAWASPAHRTVNRWWLLKTKPKCSAKTDGQAMRTKNYVKRSKAQSTHRNLLLRNVHFDVCWAQLESPQMPPTGCAACRRPWWGLLSARSTTQDSAVAFSFLPRSLHRVVNPLFFLPFFFLLTKVRDSSAHWNI